MPGFGEIFEEWERLAGQVAGFFETGMYEFDSRFVYGGRAAIADSIACVTEAPGSVMKR